MSKRRFAELSDRELSRVGTAIINNNPTARFMGAATARAVLKEEHRRKEEKKQQKPKHRKTNNQGFGFNFADL